MIFCTRALETNRVISANPFPKPTTTFSLNGMVLLSSILLLNLKVCVCSNFILFPTIDGNVGKRRGLHFFSSKLL